MQKKYLITGHSGFVGNHFINYLLSVESDATILGCDIKKSGITGIDEIEINLLDKSQVKKVVSEFQPDYLVHLASFSSVAYSWQHPNDSFVNNTNIFLTLLDEVRIEVPNCRVLSIGSSEQYGIVLENEIPLSESAELRPVSPYACARVAQEYLSKVYSAGYNMNVVCTRSFNHIGPGQTDNFFVSALIKKFVEFKRGMRENISVGNTDVIRDFLDVRDVVVAYYLLLKNGKNGEVYNICSGKGILLEKFIKLVKKITNCNPLMVQDSNLMRPVENRIVVGSNKKITAELGWEIQYSIKNSIDDIYKYWELKI